ncbi:MAG: hypothetical protein R3F59_10835 [Myxococcota bacterium]
MAPAPPSHTRVFRVTLEHPGADEGYYTLAGKRYGPFATPEEAEHHLLGRIRAWKARARSLGGDVHRRTHLEIAVTLPADVPFEGGEAPTPWVR